MSRVGEVWEVKLYKNLPSRILLFFSLRGDGSWPRHYETFDLDNCERQVVSEYEHHPFERNRTKWTRLV